VFKGSYYCVPRVGGGDPAFDINELDSYDISDMLATLIFADSSIIEKYKLEYNEDGECCDREVSGYFLDSELKRK